MDQDGDKKVSLDEMLDSCLSYYKEHGGIDAAQLKKMEAEFTKTFNKVDKDGNGTIDVEEMIYSMKHGR